MLISDLPYLDDIIDTIGVDINDDNFTSDEYEQILETTLSLIDSYVINHIKNMDEPEFYNDMYSCIYNLLDLQLSEIFTHSIENNIEEVINTASHDYFTNIVPRRSEGPTHIINENIDKIAMEKKIKYISDKPQPDQKTDEWYTFRHNLITASSAWKCIENESNRNQIIYEKCKPLDISKFKSTNLETTLHWGQKYEPISVMYYEKKFQTEIRDFGCIQHDKHKFLGASPDGINVDKKSPLYGRMLEIKNIVNRDITGIPKKEYWIQMQLQMETCDLDECDFLETRFKEYEDVDEFNEDGNFTYTKNNRIKGIIMLFMDGTNYHYEYMPLYHTKDMFEKWEEEMMNKNENKVWVNNIYWYLEEVSCVLVLRNKMWFESIIDDIGNTWSTIEKERVTGYSHRAPKKRIKKENIKVIKSENHDDQSSNTNLKQTKISKTSPLLSGCVIKIRTESFDETVI